MWSWFRKFWTPEQPVDVCAQAEHILVISDIHLGESITSEQSDILAQHIRVLNRELAGFVDTHALANAKDHPWHLVINGDMFDFVAIPLVREEDEHALSELDSDPVCPTEVETVVWKLGRILEVHRPLFKSLSRFVLAGHRVTMVEGNHDAQFYFPEVRQALSEFMLDEARKLQRQDKVELDEALFRQNVQYRPWFQAKAGLYHIEHGHQYDAYCSFEYNLAPFERGETKSIATPMTHRLLPYFSKLIGQFSTHDVDKWGMFDWVSFGLKLGPKIAGGLVKAYLTAMVELLGQSGESRRAELRHSAKLQEERLKMLAEDSDYEWATLKTLEALRATPAEFSFLTMLNIFLLDRFFTVIITLSLSLWALYYGQIWLWVLTGAVFFGCCGAVVLLDQRRGAKIEIKLKEAAAKIAAVTGTRFVIFGHSHSPEVVPLGKSNTGDKKKAPRAFYANSGSWVTHELLRGDEGKGMTYVEISEQELYLKRWNGASNVAYDIGNTLNHPDGNEKPR
jgi:UDP-2,3-diacylglucosamine pyrophosphatase LpxH